MSFFLSVSLFFVLWAFKC